MSEQNISRSNPDLDADVFFVDLIRSIIKYWWLLVMSALLFAAAFFAHAAYTFTPSYRSESTFTVTTGTTGSAMDTTYDFYFDANSAQQLGLTFPHILSSELLTDAIKLDLDTDVINGSISAETLENSNMVTMSVTGSEPAELKRILESTMKVYPEVARVVLGKIRFNIIDPPNLPTEPYNEPNYTQTVLKGAACGLFLALVIVFVYAMFRRTVHKENELQENLNLPCMVSLPFAARKERKKNTDRMISINDIGVPSWFDECIKALWVRVEAVLSESDKKVLLVTSTSDGEGKSTVAVNLAYRIAQTNKKVILVDADIRRPALGEQLGFEEFNLSAAARLGTDPKTLLRYDKKNQIAFLGGCVHVKNVSRFLSTRLRQIIDTLRQEADYIIIDAPSAAGYEDALLVREYSDAALFVVRQDFTPKNQVIETMASFDSENIPVIGYVFNGITGVLGEYGYGKYGYNKYGYSKYSYTKYGYGKYGYGKSEDRKK